jgi:peptide/nickel transport system substrate-binding protein
MRWALSAALNRQQVGEAELGGPGAIPTNYIFPAYPNLATLIEENADLFEQYPVAEYNPDKAIAIFESKGYVRGGDGIFTKDGERLQISMLMSSEWPPAQSVAPLMVGFWQAVGIDATANFLTGAQVGEQRDTGNFDVAIVSPCYSIVDPYNAVDAFHNRHVVAVGERASMNVGRWDNAEFSAIVDEMATLPAGDPALGPLWRAAMEIWLPDLPVLPMYQQVRIIPFSTTYWTNWPTAENNYVHPPTWWASTYQIIMNLEPAGTTAQSSR